MRIALLVVGAIVGIVAIITLIGFALPVGHRAQRQVTVTATPTQVFALITTIEAFPTWRPGLKSVEVLPSTADGKRRFREVSGDGTITFVMDTVDPPRRLVTRIDDKALPFGGSWTYEIIPSDSGTTLRITEDGEVFNPIFRFVSKFVMGHDRTIRQYLAAVECATTKTGPLSSAAVHGPGG